MHVQMDLLAFSMRQTKIKDLVAFAFCVVKIPMKVQITFLLPYLRPQQLQQHHHQYEHDVPGRPWKGPNPSVLHHVRGTINSAHLIGLFQSLSNAQHVNYLPEFGVVFALLLCVAIRIVMFDVMDVKHHIVTPMQFLLIIIVSITIQKLINTTNTFNTINTINTTTVSHLCRNTLSCSITF